MRSFDSVDVWTCNCPRRLVEAIEIRTWSERVDIPYTGSIYSAELSPAEVTEALSIANLSWTWDPESNSMQVEPTNVYFGFDGNNYLAVVGRRINNHECPVPTIPERWRQRHKQRLEAAAAEGDAGSRSGEG